PAPAEGSPAAPAPAETPAVAPADAGLTTGTEVAHGEGHSGGGFPPLASWTYPSQLLWLASTFGLFYVFLKRVVLPRMGGFLAVRSDRTAPDLGRAARMKGVADAAIAAYEQELATAKNKPNELGQSSRESAKAEAEAERKSAE